MAECYSWRAWSAAALAGCASGERELVGGAETKGGASVNVFPDKYRAEILAYQRSYLNDPTGIRSAAITQPALRKVGAVERYVVCVRFNAKAAGGALCGRARPHGDLPRRQARPDGGDARGMPRRGLRAVSRAGAADALGVRARMKIATFNINNINKRLPNLLAWLRAAKPDVVCLQELKATDADFPAAKIRASRI